MGHFGKPEGLAVGAVIAAVICAGWFPGAAFLLCIALLVYAWCVYPLVVRALPRREHSTDDGLCPEVAVLIPAHNEEAVIADRIGNLLELSYPPEKINIYIGVDASDDGTSAIAGGFAAEDARIRVFEYGERRGKAAVLKSLVMSCKEEILVFTDANTVFEPDAIGLLTRHFADKAVGGVCGRLVFTDDGQCSTDEGTYWALETKIKKMESDVDSCLGANGGIYAIRRGLFWHDMPDNTIVDDLVIGMKVREQGYRMIFDPEAVASEELPATVADEWRRRTRIGAGDFQALWFCRRCLLPRYGLFTLLFFSHKVLRWFTPHLCVLSLGVSLWLLRPLVRFLASEEIRLWDLSLSACAAGWCGLWLLFAGCYALNRSRPAGFAAAGLARTCAYFLAMQAALAVGFIRFCGGGLSGAWERTNRG
jgi:cellulose synthase/poly-beta-1,6-N-acetylglucosamine synthase-like glycosyltransferase